MQTHMERPHRMLLQAAGVGGPRQQRGMVTALTVLFLIATVIFALAQMLNVSGGNVIDGQRDGDSTAAFFLAESGLETAQAALSAALTGNITNASCTGVGSSFNLGSGSVTTTAVSQPASCGASGQPNCTGCTVTSTGIVGFSNRQMTQDVALTVNNGVTCNAATSDCTNSSTVAWQLRLRNTTGNAAVAVFNLTYEKQGNATPTCAAASNCQLQLDMGSPSNGTNAVGMMGNAVTIPASNTYPIYQTFASNKNANLAEVGALFTGTGTPTLTWPGTNGDSAYWSTATGGSGTRETSGSTGSTNDGTATSTGTCSAPGANRQSCTKWCYGGDTLVYTFTANTAALTDKLDEVFFNTGGTLPQNVAMTRVAKYPSNLVNGAPANVAAEVWYAYNPNVTGSTPLAVGASSYKGRGTGAVGAAWTTTSTSDTSISGTTLTVGAGFTGYPAQIISIGDTVVSTGVAASTTIVSQLSSTESGGMTTGRGGKGSYQVSISQTVTGANSRAWTANSNVLNVTACSTCFFAAADALSGLIASRTISSQTTSANTHGRTEAAGGLGRYPMSGAATRVLSANTLQAGTPGTTLYLPSGANQPVPSMRIALKSGTGALAANTSVSSVSASGSPNAATRSFVLSTAPTTALDPATLCGGTCAFFVPGGTTSFGFTKSAGTTINEWASGFVCLKGADLTPQIVTSSSSAVGRWTEAIR